LCYNPLVSSRLRIIFGLERVGNKPDSLRLILNNEEFTNTAMKTKRLADHKEEARKKITKRMRETMTFWWCRKCECLYTEANAKRILDDYFCPWDGTQLEPDTIREPKTDTLGEA